jgi:bifunctional DNA-binding transcriptional regulator/antitoxin component of YhaV-PrlF toxin-antitoxin module
MEENVRPIMAPRSRPSLQHVLIPPKIRAYFDLKVGDLLKFDVVENRIVIRVVSKDKRDGIPDCFTKSGASQRCINF